MPARPSEPKVAPTGGYTKLPAEKLLLDSQNPRLAEFGMGRNSTQAELLETLWNEMAVEEIAMSIAYSGYFDHEPLFVERNSKGENIVIEGNRRLAAVKLLLDPALRKKLRATDLPAVTPARLKELSELPVIMTTRENSWRYLGFKHVNGPSTWGSYAKAQYISHVHNKYGVPLAAIAEQIGDNNSTVQRMYRGLMIVEQAEAVKVFNRKDIAKSRFHFNYIYTGMDYPGISKFLGLDMRSVVSTTPVPKNKYKNLGELLSWLYGAESSNKPSLIQSQNPDLRTLDTILQTGEGIKALRDGLPLSVALEISLGDENVFRQALQQAKLSLQKAIGTLTTGYSLEDADSLRIASDVEQLSMELVNQMKQKRGRGERDQKNAQRKNA
jgi:hypothetical protein